MSSRRVAAGAVGASVGVALLAGCGSNRAAEDGAQSKQVKRTSIAIDYASYYPPIADIQRLATARAAAKGLAVTFSSDSAGAAAQAASLRTLTGARSGFGVVVVAPFDAAAAARAITPAQANGIKVVSYLQEVRGAAAAISVSPSAAATQLVTDAAGARDQTPKAAQRKRFLVVGAPATSPVPDPLAALGRASTAATVDALRTVGVIDPPTVTALGAADAEQAVRAAVAESPGLDTVLTWNDATALGAAQALGRRGYVGALALGGISAPGALRQLRRGGTPLREIVAPRLGDLATALVDVPANVLAGRTPPGEIVEAQRFTRAAPATRAALADYAG